MRDYIQEVWEHVESKRGETKIAERVFNWLNGDNLGAVIIDGENFWFEKTWSGASFPNFAFDYLIRFMEGRGFKYYMD